MSVDTSWDINEYRSKFEPEQHWELKQEFLLAHKETIPEDRLVSLAQVYVNMELLGSRYLSPISDQVRELSRGLGVDYHTNRLNKLQRTFVKASDAVLAKLRKEDPVTSKRRKVEAVSGGDTALNGAEATKVQLDDMTDEASSCVQLSGPNHQTNNSVSASEAGVIKKPLHVTNSLQEPARALNFIQDIWEVYEDLSNNNLPACRLNSNSVDNLRKFVSEDTKECVPSPPKSCKQNLLSGEQRQFCSLLPNKTAAKSRLKSKRKAHVTGTCPNELEEVNGGRRLCQDSSASMLCSVDGASSEDQSGNDCIPEYRRPDAAGFEQNARPPDHKDVQGGSLVGTKKRVNVTDNRSESQCSLVKKEGKNLKLKAFIADHLNPVSAILTEKQKRHGVDDAIQKVKQLTKVDIKPIEIMSKSLVKKKVHVTDQNEASDMPVKKRKKVHVTEGFTKLKGNRAADKTLLNKMNDIQALWAGEDPLATIILVNRTYDERPTGKSVLDKSLQNSRAKYTVVRNMEEKTLEGYVKDALVASVHLSADQKGLHESKEQLALAVLESLCPRCCMLEIKNPHIDDSNPIQLDDLKRVQTDVTPWSSEPIDNGNVGNKMLRLMGWSGGGLGRDSGGRTDPVEQKRVCNREGFGYSRVEPEETVSGCLGDVTPEFKKQVAVVIKEFARDVAAGVHETGELRFSPNFSKEQRALIHCTAQRERRLKSASYGTGSERYIVVSQRLSLHQKMLLAHKLRPSKGSLAVFMPGTYDLSNFNLLPSQASD